MYESRKIEKAVMWLGKPGASQLEFNTVHRMNDEARITHGEFNLGRRTSESQLNLINEDGHMISISFHPELFTKPGLNLAHYQDAVEKHVLPPVTIMHGRAGGGAISAVQVRKMQALALQVLGHLEREKGFSNALKLAKMAINQEMTQQKKAA